MYMWTIVGLLNLFALAFVSGIPIFVLKISCDANEYDTYYDENGKSILFRSQEQLQDACFDFFNVSSNHIFLQHLCVF